MRPAACAEDAVSLRRVRLRGISESTLRRELALVVTPRVRQWIFMRQLSVRSGPHRVGASLQSALQRVALGVDDPTGAEVVTFPDFPALVVACARDALSGQLSSWHWRSLGLPTSQSAGDSVARLLIEHALEAGTAVALLAGQQLLGPVWRSMSPQIAFELACAVASASRIPLPCWPPNEGGPAAAEELRVAEPVTQRASDLWRPVLSGLPLRAEAVRTAAILALLRWSPHTLSVSHAHLPASFLEGLTGCASVPRLEVQDEPGPGGAQPTESRADPSPTAVHSTLFASPTADAPTDLHGGAPGREVDQVATHWGGVLFLINSLNRLDVGKRLATVEGDGPSGWRLLLDVAVSLGLPLDEPLTAFLTANDPESPSAPELTREMLAGLGELYATDGPWPLPLRQPALLESTPTHLDLHLQVASVEVDVRMAGLDLDPGWVPWLGRIIQFHYDHLPTHVAATR